MGNFPFTATGGLPSLPLVVSNGGTGDATLTAFAVLTGGTTTTSPVQTVAALGTAGMPLSSGGAGALPAFGPSDAASFALTDGATIAVNAALGNYATVTIAGNRTISAPSNPPAAGSQTLIFEVTQGSGGSHTLAWTSGAGGFSFGSGSAPTLSTSAGVADLIGFRYSQGVGKWLFIGSETGYS